MSSMNVIRNQVHLPTSSEKHSLRCWTQHNCINLTQHITRRHFNFASRDFGKRRFLFRFSRVDCESPLLSKPLRIIPSNKRDKSLFSQASRAYIAPAEV